MAKEKKAEKNKPRKKDESRGRRGGGDGKEGRGRRKRRRRKIEGLKGASEGEAERAVSKKHAVRVREETSTAGVPQMRLLLSSSSLIASFVVMLT